MKPDFFTSEQVLNLTPLARLLFIGLWVFSDDGGNHPASARTLKAEVFPGDDMATTDVQKLIDEMIEQALIEAYDAQGRSYWHVTGWKRHQRIEKPTFKHPEPPDAEPSPTAREPLGAGLTTGQRALAESSTTTRRTLANVSMTSRDLLAPGMEGNGEEGNGDREDGEHAASAGPSSPKDCPHDQIVALYHKVLPTARRVREWTPSRQQALRTRWRERAERQDLAWWERFFDYIATSDFLCGRTSAPGRRPFDLGLDWLLKSENFAKVIEGAYDNRQPTSEVQA